LPSSPADYLSLFTSPLMVAQNDSDQRTHSRIDGVFVTVPSPITSATFHSIRRQCQVALRRGVDVIVFHIEPGKSNYGDCLNLAHYIEGIQGAKTVAFITGRVTGHAVLVALAADELVMSPDAELGNAGEDERTIRPGMRAEYHDLAVRRHRPYAAVIMGMLDKELRVWRVTTPAGVRYALDDELEQIQRAEGIQEKEVLIESGQFGLFTGSRLRQIGLVRLTARDRAEVARAYGLPPKAAVQEMRIGMDWRPVRIRVEGFISPMTVQFVRRNIQRYRERGFNFFIFEINSYGGRVDAGLELAELLRDLEGVKTVAYIPEKAISAAAFVAIGCDEIVMSRNAKLGDCGVWFVKGGELYYLEEKQLSYIVTALETVAKAKGYPVTLVKAMVLKDIVVKEVRDPKTGRIEYLDERQLRERADEGLIVIRTVKTAGTFLTLTGEQAQQLGLASDLVESFDEVRAVYGFEDKRVEVATPTWVDSLVWTLSRPWIGGLLLTAAIVLLYVEFHVPGVGLPAIGSALCFLLFFWSRFMGGSATTLEILLFLAGMALLAIEILVLPGFGVFGLTGIILLVFSVILASQTFVWPQTDREWATLSRNIGSLVFAFVAAGITMYLISKYLPHMPVVGRLVLQPQEHESVHVRSSNEELLGSEGVAVTVLRPAGRAKFGDRLVDVVTEGEYLEPGTKLKVIEVSGNRVLVKPV